MIYREQMGFNYGVTASNMGEGPVNLVNEKIARAATGATAPALTERIKERPLLSVGLGGLAGFVFGGGAASRFGGAMLMLIARLSLKQAASDALAYAVKQQWNNLAKPLGSIENSNTRSATSARPSSR